jgi:retron-type reverse transcriptase
VEAADSTIPWMHCWWPDPKEGELGLDADIKDFFNAMSYEWMLKFVEHRIAASRTIRLVRKWLLGKRFAP